MANRIPCSQCGQRPAFYQLEGHLLCLNCYDQFQRVESRKNAELAALANFCSELIPHQIGLSDRMPRLEIPKPVNVHMGNFNNITVDRSVVGAINTGEVGRIDVALDHLRARGQDDLADELQALTQAVVNSKELAHEAKNEALEALSSLTEQAAMPKGKSGEVSRRC